MNEIKISYLKDRIAMISEKHKADLAQYDLKHSERIRLYLKDSLDELNYQVKVEVFNFFAYILKLENKVTSMEKTEESLQKIIAEQNEQLV